MDDISYRDLGPADMDDLMAMASVWRVVRQLGGWPWPPDRAAMEHRCRPYEGDGFVWGIDRGGRVIGTIGVIRGDLGYVLHPDWHGQGIMTRAARVAVERTFETTTRRHLTASTWADNPVSARLLRRLGFVHWQTHFERSVARGLPTLLHRHRLDRSTWSALRPAPQ